MATLEETRPHALVFAYPLLGHVIPTVFLAINLASRGFTVTFINNHSIHHHISKANSSSHHHDIFASVRHKGLDIRYTTISDSLPVELKRSRNHDQFLESFLHVLPAHVEELVAKLVRQSVPPMTCLIADTFFLWPSAVAKKFGLPYVSFWTEPALVFSIYYHLDLLKKSGHFACQHNRKDLINYIPGVKSIHPKDLPSYLQQTKSFNDVRRADFVHCNTVQELEPHTITALQPQTDLYAIGPIFPFCFC